METYRETILKEAYNYKGSMFWENYMLSNIVRTVSRDLKEYQDPELVVELYGALYGEESTELFEDMVNNEEELHEAAKITGAFLFEGIGERNVNAYLNEVILSKFAPGLTGVIGSTTKPIGFLKGLWSKFKGIFSSGTFATIGAFLKNGFSWAKDLITKGATWVAKTPIINVAVPMLMVFGGLKAAKAIVNKMRRKSGKKIMTPEEERQFDKVAAKNKNKIEKARLKVLKKAA